MTECCFAFRTHAELIDLPVTGLLLNSLRKAYKSSFNPGKSTRVSVLQLVLT